MQELKNLRWLFRHARLANKQHPARTIEGVKGHARHTWCSHRRDRLSSEGSYFSGSETALRTRSFPPACTKNSSFPSSVRAIAFLAMISDLPFGIRFQTRSLIFGPFGAPMVDFHGSSSFGQKTMLAVVASGPRPPVITTPKVFIPSPSRKMLSPLSVSAKVAPQGLLSRYTCP
jgi:hypothetical protein